MVVLQMSFSFWFRAQTPDMRKMQHPPRENLFSLGALSRRRRQEDEEIKTKNNQKNNDQNIENSATFLTFSVPQGVPAKMLPKWPPGASPGPSGGLPGSQN